MDPVLLLGVLAVAFVGSHLLLSHPPVRERLVERLGPRRFRLGYSVLSIVLYAPLAWLWWTDRRAGAALWDPGDALVPLAEATAATGLALAVAGVAQPAPSSLEVRDRPEYEVRGIAHVTRHPLMAGIALLSAAHLLVSGWVPDLVFWGSNLVLAVVGAVHQDQRHRAARPAYAAYAERTSAWPNPAGLARMGARALLAGLLGIVLAVALRWAHRWF